VRERRVTANALEFGVLELGGGPLALCLHGFPDSAHTWRHLLPALADAGFHAVAPFMRGYAPTAVPADGKYDLETLAGDAAGLHDCLGGDGRAILIGHDWGAEAAYVAAAREPDRWRRVVTLAIPPFALDRRLFSDYDQLRRFFYLFLLRTPLAEEVVAADGMAFLDRLWEDWSPGYAAAGDLEQVKRCLSEPANLRAAIAYYRADDLDAAPAPAGPQPTLYLHGDRDGCIDVGLVRDAARHLASGSRLEIVPGAGHFLQVEKPRAVNELILDWVAQSG
jgi:pimeloyl-ACP methyl ester carboxylesterase